MQTDDRHLSLPGYLIQHFNAKGMTQQKDAHLKLQSIDPAAARRCGTARVGSVVSQDYLPAESSFEVAMADKLAAAGRTFTKPMRYESRPGTGPVLPDFVLTDTRPATVVEVFGVTGRADYDARAREKRAYYAREGIPLLFISNGCREV